MLIVIDPAHTDPIYLQISQQIRQRIAEGVLNPGDRLPTADDIAAAVGVNKNTVLQALRLLRDEGVIELRRGRGAIVLPTSQSQMEASIAALIDALSEKAKAASLSLATITEELQKKGLQ